MNPQRLATILFGCIGLGCEFGSYRAFPVPKYLTYDISESSFEVPLVLTNIALQSKSWGHDSLVLPLADSVTALTRRTAQNIIYDLSYYNFNKVRTAKGNIYHGIKGLIMNENFEPLLIVSSNIQTDGTISSSRITGINLYLDFKVFSVDTILEKTIIKQIIPSLHNYPIYPVGTVISSNTPYNVSIMVKDLSNLVTTTTTPSVSTTRETLIADITRHQ